VKRSATSDASNPTGITSNVPTGTRTSTEVSITISRTAGTGGACNKLVQENMVACYDEMTIQEGCCSKNCSAALAAMLDGGCLAEVTLAACQNNVTYGMLSNQLTNTMRRCLPASSISTCTGLAAASDRGNLVEITKDLSAATGALLAGNGTTMPKTNGATGTAADALSLLALAVAALFVL
jgi:hypothetical protein